MTATTEETRAVVQGVYDAVMKGDMDAFGALLHPEMRVSSAPYLAHGGPDSEVARWQAMLAGLGPALDIGGIRLDFLIAEGDKASATVYAPLRNSEAEILFCENWEVRDGKAYRMRVYCYDPAPLQKALAE